MSALRLRGDQFIRGVHDRESAVETALAELLEASVSKPSASEYRSWMTSLPVLAEDLEEAGLEDIEILLEYRLPLTSQRVDAILAGSHPETGEPSYVIVELKQWSKARLFEDDPNLLDVAGVSSPRLHPSRQVEGYKRYLLNYLSVLHDHENWVEAFSYLHNMNDPSSIEAVRGAAGDSKVFTSTDRLRLRALLQSRLSPKNAAASADAILSSPVAPSTKLMEIAAEEVRQREKFVLLGEQQLAVDLIHHEIENAVTDAQKRVIVVTGGPGSGKSAIALSALGELARGGRTVLHATGSRSFTQTLRKVAGHRSKDTQSLFKYFNSFSDADQNGFDVLIADEAHRIRETSNNRFTPAVKRSDRLQIDELIAAARVPVFLLDENQTVRNGELGSVDDISRFARLAGHDVKVIELTSQFRCGGSSAYVEWVEQILGLTEGEPAEATLPEDEVFDVSVAETPFELESRIEQKAQQGETARLVAGFCWPWSDSDASGLVEDVKIAGWSKPWNNKSDRRIGDAPPSALWATEAGGLGQVGCIYTAQGFEFDWAGVILGPDLIWRDDQFESIRSANKDPHFRSRRAVSDDQFDLLVRHTYKVLLTRGMKGVILYSPDAQTRSALRELLR